MALEFDLHGHLAKNPSWDKLTRDRYFTGYIWPFATFHTVIFDLALASLLDVFYIIAL